MSEKLSPEEFAKLFAVISEEAIMGFLSFDLTTGSCVFANKLGKQTMEFGLEEDVTTLKLEQLFPEDTERTNKSGFRPLKKEMFNNEGLYQGVLVCKINKHQFISNLGVKKLKMDNKEHLLLMIQDVTLQNKLQREVMAKQTEIKAAYEELVKQNEQLKTLDKAKDKFIALTTHELRTPASAMVASADVLKMKLYDNQEQLDEFIDMVYDQGIHLLELINDVLDFSKIQAGKMDYYVEHGSLLKVASEEVATIESFAAESNITINLISTGEDFDCYFDDLRLSQVIRNILSNAVKYNVKGGSVEVSLKTENGLAKVIVKDTGKGIPEEELALVFNEFETLGKVAQHHQGTGLGMPISKQMIESMGGSIGVTSEVGKGSTFWIEVPTEKVLDEEVYRARPDMFGDLAA